MIPKVKFKLATIKREAEMLLVFCKPEKEDWDWSNIIYKVHPKLKEILDGKKSSEFYKLTYEYTKKFFNKNKGALGGLAKKYQNNWDKINDEYFRILSEHFETGYPSNKRYINAYVSIVPIYPRFLSEWAFNVSSTDQKSLIPISMHEILHFMYFKKWMEVFPKTKLRELDSPHLVWKLSEILAPIILNNNKEIQKLHKHKQGHYSEFEKVKIDDKTMIKHFEDLYKEHLKKHSTFEEFLKICLTEVQQNKGMIEGI